MQDMILHSAYTRHGSPIPVYCDGDGPCFVLFHSLGIQGIARARTWEDAWEICEDEFLDECELSLAELEAEYGHRREHVKIIRDGAAERPAVHPADYPNGRLAPGLAFVRWDTVCTPDPDAWAENDLFLEAYGFRPNGPRAGGRDRVGHGIYARDLSGERLELLTPELAADLGIVRVWETY